MAAVTAVSSSNLLPFPGFFTRWYIQLRVWIGIILCKQLPVTRGIDDSDEGNTIEYSSRIINVGFGQYVKTKATANEVMAMRYVRANTRIPIPKVYGAWTWPGKFTGRCYVLMEKIPGITLERLWPKLKRSQRMKIARRLASYIHELRKVQQPVASSGTVSSFIGGPLDDDGLNPVYYHSKDWFETVEAFVDNILCPIAWEKPYDTSKEKAILLQRTNRELVLTHGDLTMRNIIVDPESLKIKGLIDWATAAYLPRY